MAISVLIASRVYLYAEGIKNLLAGDDALHLCGIACSHEQLGAMLGAGPDVVVADQAILRDSVISPPSKLLLVHDQPSFSVKTKELQGMIANGLAGILANNTDGQMLRKAIVTVAAGQLWLDQNTIKHVLCEADGPGRDLPLTGKEAEVLHHLCAGLSNKEIAEKLFISEQTIKSHCHHLFKKFGVDNRVKLVLAVAERNRASSWPPGE